SVGWETEVATGVEARVERTAGGGIGAGAALVDLRYLGPKRVLVLVDGVRWVNGSSASGVASATDLNTIPASIIERIEILQDGASPIYGSDAIAGVVNIITRKESQGISANAYIGAFGQGDGVTQQYDLGWGQTGEETSVFFNVSYTRQGDISAADRAISRFPLPNFDRCTNNCSSGTPQGRFFLTDPNTGESLDLTINNGAVGDPRIRYDPTNPTGPNSDFNAFDTEDRFNFAPFNFVQTPNERLGIFAQATHKISEEVTLFGRALYNNRRSRNQAAPEPLFIGSEAGNGNRLDTISVDATNIYNPFGFTVDASSPYFFGRRPLEAGPRIFEQNVDTWYVAGGLKGNFGIGDIDVFWDATALYTRNRADQIKNGAFNSAKLQIALGPNDLCMAEPGCVPFNFFGGQGADGQGTITQEMLDYVSFVQKDVSEQQMWDVVLNLGANLIELPGGDLSIAVGYEHRDQSGFFRPDAVVVAGDSAGVPSSPTSGRFSVNEAYAEIVLPLVKGVIGADLLDLSSAIRISDYSTFGLEETFKVGMRWRPFEDLLIRGTFAQGFRAPGIGELFGSASRFDQTLNDPCSDLLGSNGTAAPENVRQNCIQQGVPADGSYQQFNPQISVTTGGNRELDPETSDSWTATMAYSPWWLNTLSWVQQFSLELTYYRISVEGAIQAIDAQVQLDRCAETGDPVLCAGISRTGEGTINGFANRLTNIGEVEVDGFDIVLSYSTPDTSAGRFGIFWPSSFLFNFTQRVPSADGFEVIEREGREVGDPEQAFPQFKSSLIISWVLDRWSAFFTNRYIHSVTEPCRGLEEFPDTCSDPNPNDDSLSENKLEARLYTDLQVSYRPPVLDDRLNISVGVNNLFNQDPPACYSCALNGFDATTYLVPGVFGYVRAAYTTN
ncbi:MAG: TonB-dependent receptor, partial [Myxococcota bacterium]